MKAFTRPISSVLILACTAMALASCGNAWVSSNARKQTPSAMMLDAQLAYDDQEYAAAAALYEKVVAMDPENAEARTRLAFAYNAQAGLAVFDLVGKMLTYGKSSGAGEGGSGSGGMSSFSGIVGLSEVEKGDLKAALNAKMKASPSGGKDRLNLAVTTLADLRAKSPKLAFLHASFARACKLIPRHILDSVIRESDSAEIKLSQIFELDTACNGGVPAGGPINTGAMFATAIGSLAQAAILYQIALDPDGNGSIDLADDSTALSTKLTTLQNDIATAPSTLSGLSLISTKMKELNTNTTALLDLGKELSGEIVSATAIHFNLITLLIAEIPGIPSSVQKSINDAIGKFNESKKALAGVVSPSSPLARDPKAASGTTPAPADNQSKDFLDNSSKASGSMDEAYAKQKAIIDSSANDGSLTPAEKEAKQAELDKNYDDACTNFEMLRIVYNRPDAKKPDNCPK